MQDSGVLHRGVANVCLELEQRHCDPLARNDAYN